MIFAISLALLLAVFEFGVVSGAPTTTLSISEPKHGTAPVYVSDLTEFTLSSSDSGAPVTDIWYKWSNYNYTKYTGPFNAVVELVSTSGAPLLPIDLEGPQTLYFNATGEAPKTQQVYVDLYYPNTQASIVGLNTSGTYTFVTTETGIKLSASDTESGVSGTYYKIDSGNYTAYVSPIKLTGVSGPKKITYYSSDNVENNEIEDSITVYLDADPPDVSLSASTPNLKLSTTMFVSQSTYLTISATDISGVKDISYKIDGGTWTTFTNAFNVLGEGPHTIYGKATDNLGHQSAEISFSITVDNTPPEVHAVGIDSDSVRIQNGDKIELESTDSVVGVDYISFSTDGGTTWNKYTFALYFDKDTELMYEATDLLGNTGETNTLKVTVAGPARPWTFYLGIILIIAAVIYLAYSFLPKKGTPEEGEPKEKKKKVKEKAREEEEEGIETKSKRKKRNR